MKQFPLVFFIFLVSTAVFGMNDQYNLKNKEIPSLKALVARNFESYPFNEVKELIRTSYYKGKQIPTELAIDLGKRLIFAGEKLTVGQKQELIEIFKNNEEILSETDKKILRHYGWLIESVKPELVMKHDYIYVKDDVWNKKSYFCQNLIGHTLVSNAILNGFEQLLDALLLYEGKTILQLKDLNGKQLLHYTQTCGHLSYLTKKFIEQGADLNAQDIEGKTPLHDTCYYSISNSINKTKSNIILLLEAGALKNIKNIYDQSPLDMLRLWGNYPEIEELFEKYKNS